MTANLTTVTIGPNASLVYGGQGSQAAQIQVTNLSGSVTLWIGSSPNVAAGSFALGIPLGPGASLTMNGTVSVYAVAPAGQTAQLAVIPEGVSYAPGTAIAPVYQVMSPQTLGPSTLTTVMSYADISGFASYDLNMILIDASQKTAGHALACQVTLTWYDELVTGIPVFTETWTPWVLTGGGSNNNVVASGPMHGQYMTVTVLNPSATGAVTLSSFNLFGSPRTVNLSDWRQNPGTYVSDAVLHSNSPGTGNGYDNVLFDTGGLTAVTAVNYMFCLKLYAGPVLVSVQSGSGLVGSFTLCDVGTNYMQDVSGSVSDNAGVITGLQPSSSVVTYPVMLPRAVCAVLASVTTAGTFNLKVTAQQGP